MRLTLKQRIVILVSDGLLLLLGLYGILFSLLTAFRLPYGAPLLPLLPLLCAGALALFSLPKLRNRLPLVLLWLGALAWAVWANLQSLIYAALTLAQLVGGIFAQKLGMGLVAPDFGDYLAPFVAQGLAGTTEAITRLLLLFAALLALGLGWAVVRRRSFWLGFLFTLPLLAAPLSITVTPHWTPLTALLLFWCLSLLGRLPGLHDPYGKAKLSLLALPLTLLLLAGLRLALPAATYTESDWARTTRLELLSKISSLGQDMATGTLGSGLAGGSVEVDLSRAGPLRYTGRTVLRVESETTGHIYLRGFSSATYTERGWEQLTDAVYEEMRHGWVYTFDTDLSSGDPTAVDTPISLTLPGMRDVFQPINFPALADPSAPSHTFTIENIGAATPYVFTPYQLATTPDRMTGATFVGDSYLARGAGIWRYVLYARDTLNPEHGATLTGDAALAEDAYRKFVNTHYLQVPAYLDQTLAAVLNDFFQWGSAEDIYYGGGLPGASLHRIDMANRLARYLADLARYDAETPHTPSGEDFVAYFLTESHTGYCMHFASATTLLLRAMGVPARYVAGYTADVKAGQSVPVPDRNAHAWVEVYLDGYGWQPVEVTPGFSGAFPWSSEQESPTVTPSPTPSQSQQPTPTPDRPTPTPSGGGAASRTQLDLRPLLVALALGLALFFAWKRRGWTVARRNTRFQQPDTNRGAVAMYLYAQRLLRYHPGETLDAAVHDLGEKAAFSQHILTEDERAQMWSYTADLAQRTEALPGAWRQLVIRYIWCLC